MDPGKKLALARKYYGPALTQGDLAAKLGVARSTVARWESEGNPPLDVLEQTAHELGISVQWFYDPLEEKLPGFASPNARPFRPDARDGASSSLVRGDQALLPVWRGVMASEGECEFWPTDDLEFRGVPAFLASSDPEGHVLCIASGLSMSPRIDHAEKAIVKLDPDPPIGAIVVARRPDGANFIKVLRKVNDRWLELHSLNPDFSPIKELKDWSLKGYVVAILHTYSGQGANIEWDDGRPLRA